MKKLKINNGVREIVELPKTIKYNGKEITQFPKRTELHFENGYYNIAYPTLTENEQIDTDLDNGTIEDDTFTYGVKDIPEPTAEEIAYQKKQERNELLRQGVIISNIWFNEEKLTQFSVMAQMAQVNGLTKFEWGYENGWGDVLIADAMNIILQASTEFSNIYKQYA